MLRLSLLVAWLVLAPMAAQGCDFRYDPASTATYYRASGWILPGTTDFNIKTKPSLDGGPELKNIPGVRAELLPHDEEPYVIELPAQDFVLPTGRMKLRSMQAKATIARHKIGNMVIAYSYGLVPVTAERVDGQWVIKSEAGCIFTATFIDDKGDGIFRSLVPGPLTPDLIPDWAKRRDW